MLFNAGLYLYTDLIGKESRESEDIKLNIVKQIWRAHEQEPPRDPYRWSFCHSHDFVGCL
jgi:hypothetical protein